MKDLLEISCGLDVHKDKIVACILTGPLGKPTHSEIREFTTLIPDMSPYGIGLFLKTAIMLPWKAPAFTGCLSMKY